MLPLLGMLSIAKLRVEERLRPFKDNIETHEKNIEALRRELSNLR